MTVALANTTYCHEFDNSHLQSFYLDMFSIIDLCSHVSMLLPFDVYSEYQHSLCSLLSSTFGFSLSSVIHSPATGYKPRYLTWYAYYVISCSSSFLITNPVFLVCRLAHTGNTSSFFKLSISVCILKLTQ